MTFVFKLNANKFKPIFIGVFLFFVLNSAMFSQTLSSTTLSQTSGTATSDTIKAIIYRVNYQIGTIEDIASANSHSITKYSLGKYNYSSLVELLRYETNFYTLKQSGFNQYEQLILNGEQAGYAKMGINTIGMTENLYGNSNLNSINSEFFDNAILLRGSAANALFGTNGSAINFQKRIFNAKSPITRFWYSDAGRDFIGIEALYTHNLQENLNFNMNVRGDKHSGEYVNNASEMWNVNIGLRWQRDSLRYLQTDYLFNNSSINANGGIDRNSTNLIDNIVAIPLYQNFLDRSFRNTLIITANEFLNSNNEVKVNLSYNKIDFRRTRGSELALDTLLPELQIFSESTISGKFELISKANNKYQNNLIATASLVSIDKNEYGSANNYLNFFVSDQIKLNSVTLNGNFKVDYGKFMVGFGGNYSIDFAESHLNFDLSYSMQNNYLFSDNVSKNFLGLAQYKLETESCKFAMEVYFRQFLNYVNYLPIKNISGYVVNLKAEDVSGIANSGVKLDYQSKLFSKVFAETDNINFSLSIAANLEFGTLKYLPLAEVMFAPRYTLLVGKSQMHIDFTHRVSYQKFGYTFMPLLHQYYIQEFPSNFQWNGGDINLITKLGNANLKLSFQNIFDSGHYVMPISPLLGRYMRFSVSMSFFD